MQEKRSAADQARLPTADGGPLVLVVSDVRLMREGIARLLTDDARMRLAAAVGVEDAVVRLGSETPDVVLLDAAVVARSTIMARIREAALASKLVAFALSEEDDEVLACAQAGISGFVSCEASCQDLIAAIDECWRGAFAASPRLTALLLGRIASLAGSAAPALPARLTRREQDIAPLLARGLSNKEIARLLRVEATTVKNHVHNILGKLQLRRRAQLAGCLRGAGATHEIGAADQPAYADALWPEDERASSHDGGALV